MNPPRNTAWNAVLTGVGDEQGNNRSSGFGTIREDDPLYLPGSDHPGYVLVSTPLTCSNYLSWSRSMMIALGAKTKLGFINGKVEMPEHDLPSYEQWKKVDCIVISWILNSISKEIVEAFLYANLAKDLWDDIAQRFGECNGPLLFQLQKDITNINQGTQPVVVYFTKLKRLWDEIGSLVPLPVCTCGASKALTDMDMNGKLIQFLIGLNDSYDHVRSQILLIDPLPTVNKAYSMILSVEKQRTVHSSVLDSQEHSTMFNKIVSHTRGIVNRPVFNNFGGGKGRGIQRKTKEEKARLVCEFFQGTGHEVNECFKLHGYPNWYKKFKDQKNKPFSINMAEIDANPSQKHITGIMERMSLSQI